MKNISVFYKKYSHSQVLCTVKARSVVKLALKDSYVVYITKTVFPVRNKLPATSAGSKKII